MFDNNERVMAVRRELVGLIRVHRRGIPRLTRDELSMAAWVLVMARERGEFTIDYTELGYAHAERVLTTLRRLGLIDPETRCTFKLEPLGVAVLKGAQ